jgi:alpha-D-xyloside xylohydrolase
MQTRTAKHRFLVAIFASVLYSVALVRGAIGEVEGVHREANGVLIRADGCSILLTPYTDGAVRVEEAPTRALLEKTSFAVTALPAKIDWTLDENTNRVSLRTKKLTAEVDKETGKLAFFDANHRPLLSQSEVKFAPAQDVHRDGFQITATFQRASGERFFGGGVLGDDFLWQSVDVPLENDYLQMHIPIVYSTRGYGFFWDNPSRGQLHEDAHAVTWKANAGDCADFFVFAGPRADDTIAEYRALTGSAPMFPRWAYGLWFSRNRFKTQREILDAAATFRERKFPLDLIVQDYFYWQPDNAPDQGTNWGSHEFSRDRYPDAAQMIADLHQKDHLHFMAVIWGKFDPQTSHGKELASAGCLYPEHGDWAAKRLRYYDPFNPRAREIYGRQVVDSLFHIGVDAFWMDGAEPEIPMDTYANFQTALGPASRVMCAFPTMHTTTMHDALRAASSKKRVVLLPRSAWAGEQRNGACSWTSDVRQDWGTFCWQIKGLQNYCITGLPYITTDVGGYSPVPESDRELFIRWFQWGAFCPIFRVHGIDRPFPWDYGNKAENILRSTAQLRYRLLPYIYAQADRIAHMSGTIHRPLVMDFPDDPKAVATWDEFCFGPEMLICPVHDCSRQTVDVSQIADERGDKGFVSVHVQNHNQAMSIPLSDELLPLKDKSGLMNESDAVRVDGAFTSDQSGDFAIEIAPEHEPRIPKTTVTIGGRTIASSSEPIDWVNREYPFNASAGKPVKFSIEFESNQPVFRIEKHVPFQREVYLPAGADWIDFESGKKLAGGQTIVAAAPLERIPIYVRAGSILPMGPELQYADEKPMTSIELRIYGGADGSFDFYDDAGDGYGYEAGQCVHIPIRWDDRSHLLTIGKQLGAYPEMPARRAFHIVVVRPGRGVGESPLGDAKADADVDYAGQPVAIHVGF